MDGEGFESREESQAYKDLDVLLEILTEELEDTYEDKMIGTRLLKTHRK